mgnify:CR=1 FL=1
MRHQLEHHFREQQRFAEGYSPLYAHLFAIVADWLAADAADPVVGWLIEAAAERPPFDVTLLLMAALHRDVLAGEPAAAELGRYYTTAEVTPVARPPTNDHRPPSEKAPPLAAVSGLPSAVILRATILARRDALGEFIRTANVQTNETGRGLVWLLPVACMGWDAVHLVELGASAGLNLVADRRVYRLADAAEPSRTQLQLGAGAPPQFTTLVRGGAARPPTAEATPVARTPPEVATPLAAVVGRRSAVDLPTILSRTGGDVRPFQLRDAEDELTLASYIWGDQAQRMARLCEGIAALRSVERSAAPVHLAPLNLPDELPRFLTNELPRPLDAPVVIYNTVVTLYLPDRGASLRGMVAEWAARQSVPVLWLQWEPSRDGPPPPEREWMAWTADYWPNDGRPARCSRLAWVHPHGTALEWVEG